MWQQQHTQEEEVTVSKYIQKETEWVFAFGCWTVAWSVCLLLLLLPSSVRVRDCGWASGFEVEWTKLNLCDVFIAGDEVEERESKARDGRV